MSTLRIANTDARKLLRATALERDVQRAIVGYLTARGIPHSVTDATEAYNRAGKRVARVTTIGWPDVVGVWQGMAVMCECKRAAGGVLSYQQAVVLESLYRQGALIVVARSVDDVAALLTTRKASQATLSEIAKALAKGPDLQKAARRAMGRKRRTRKTK